MNGRLVVISLFLGGCATIDLPASVAYPSICDGDAGCEKRANAVTLYQMGYRAAGVRILCDDPDVRMVLEVQCKSDALPYP